MKVVTSCCLGLLLLFTSALSAQLRVLPPPNPPCGGLSSLSEWGSQFRFLPCHTGFNPYEVILSPATVGSLVLDWRYRTGNPITSSPAVANGVVYVGSFDDNVYALAARTGALLWNYTTGNYVESSPTVVNGVVYIGSDDDSVYALNAASGALLWKYTTGGLSMLRPRWPMACCTSGLTTVTYTP